MPLMDLPPRPWARVRTLLLLAVAITLAWFLIESLVYRSGIYYRLLAEPQSNAGATTLRLARARHESTDSRPTVLVIGDSRIGEGFSKPVAEARAPGFTFVNMAVPGSRPRAWYYLLRSVRRDGVPFRIVVVGLPYRPMEGGGDFADWSLDPAFMAPLVDLRDAREFPASFASEAMRERARQAIWLPALLMQKDTQALLTSPRERWKALLGKRWWLDNASNYAGRDERMPDLDFDEQRHVQDWKDTTDKQRAVLEQHLSELASTPPLRNDGYYARWLGALLAQAREQGATLMIFPLPRGPYPQVLPAFEPLPPSLAALADEPDVTVLPPDFLAELEAPRYFFDTLHANSEGRRITSERVADAVATFTATEGARQQ